eukprot:11382925-Heterocapsa_arctica.AAC.1
MSQAPTSLSQRVKALEVAGKLGDQRVEGDQRQAHREGQVGHARGIYPRGCGAAQGHHRAA